MDVERFRDMRGWPIAW